MTDCEITNNEFYYPIPSNAPCTEYVFNVRGINAAGMGEPSTILYGANEGMFVFHTAQKLIVAIKIATAEV